MNSREDYSCYVVTTKVLHAAKTRLRNIMLCLCDFRVLEYTVLTGVRRVGGVTSLTT